MEDRIRIYEQKILPALKKNHIIFYQSRNVEPFHHDFVRRFFREEIFPFLQPVPVSKDKVISFRAIIVCILPSVFNRKDCRPVLRDVRNIS